jgi:hypothetical protein
MPETWGGRSTFDYVGSVETGTRITYGKGHTVEISAQQYAALRQFFLNRAVPAGTPRTKAPGESLGAWLQANVTRTAIASYVAPILILEKYAERVGDYDIRITR